MPTWNKELHGLSLGDINAISLKYLMGWQDLIGIGYGFRVKGLNAMRKKHGLEPLTKEWSFQYRLEYVKSHFTDEEIYETIAGYLKGERVGDTRWTGIELFGCRFGREYARFFKALLGASQYRKLSEKYRLEKSMETQVSLYGGMGLGGDVTRQKAIATNIVRHGGTNVMDDVAVRKKMAATNIQKYGGVSPFSSNKVRDRALKVKNPELWKAMIEYKKTGLLGKDSLVESRYEFQVLKLLVSRFGGSDVFCQYGIHPTDKRYPHNCDFYIRSLDLFIELHLHQSHVGHFYDPSNPDDVRFLTEMKVSGTRKGKSICDVWAGRDVKKREDAKRAGLNYLVFWGDRRCLPNSIIPDFEEWFYAYDCDYVAFIADHPENTY